MKTELTIEQSQRLIELGVDPSLASEIHPYCDEVSQWTNRGYAIFNISDVISLLPKELCEWRNGIRFGYHLSMYGSNKTWGAMYRLDCGDDFLEAFDSPELIDALFELLVWCITNKHIEL